MSSTKRIANVGGSVRADDFNGAAGAAAAADDRALEILCTPGSTQKKIEPLGEETASFNPRLLVVGKDTDGAIANGVVRLRPCYLAAGVSGDPNTIGLAAKRGTNLDSAVFGNNSSGSTRFDLLYATISYGTLLQESVRQKPLSGGAPVSTLLTTEADMLVTLSIVPGVASGNPLASLPVDAVDGSSYNFGLAMVSIANGFSGGAVNQSTITPLWSGGWIQNHRIQQLRPAPTFYGGAATERPAGAMLSDRWGAQLSYFAHLKLVTATPTSAVGAPVLDSTIDWRKRIIWGYFFYLGSAGTVYPLETAAISNVILSPTSQAGANWGHLAAQYTGATPAVGAATTQYGASANNNINLLVSDATGNLIVYRGSTLIDGTNGDALALMIYATDQFKAGI